MMIREFVWKIRGFNGTLLYKRGMFGDCVELLMLFLEKNSPSLASIICNFPGKEVNRSHICSLNPSHCYYNKLEFQSYIDLNPQMRNVLSVGGKRCFFEEKDLETEFSSVFEFQKLYNKRDGVCESKYCNGVAEHINTISNPLPPFLFVGDPTNNIGAYRREQVPNLYLPSVLRVCGGVEYLLHARVYSTQQIGMRFFTVCYKQINGKTFLVRIDNLTQHMVIITSNMQRAKQILKNSEYTLYACYKKK